MNLLTVLDEAKGAPASFIERVKQNAIVLIGCHIEPVHAVAREQLARGQITGGKTAGIIAASLRGHRPAIAPYLMPDARLDSIPIPSAIEVITSVATTLSPSMSDGFAYNGVGL